jgi:hypothetical protein
MIHSLFERCKHLYVFLKWNSKYSIGKFRWLAHRWMIRLHDMGQRFYGESLTSSLSDNFS